MMTKIHETLIDMRNMTEMRDKYHIITQHSPLPNRDSNERARSVRDNKPNI